MFETGGQRKKKEHRRVIAFVLALALACSFLPSMGNVEEVSGAVVGNIGVVEFTAADTPVTLTIGEDGTITASPNTITIPAGQPSITIGAFNVKEQNASVSAITPAINSTPSVADGIVVDIDWNIDDGSTGSGSCTITVTESDPGYIEEVIINGNPASCVWNQGEYRVEQSISSGSGSIGILCGSGAVVSSVGTEGGTITEEVGVELIRQYAYSGVTEELGGFFELGGSATGIRLVVILRVSPPSPPSGGSGGKVENSEPPIQVANKENSTNVSSDTTLIPTETVEKEGTSSTQVSGREVDALIKMIEEHKDDVPQGDREAIIEIRDSEGVESKEYDVTLAEGDTKKLVNSLTDSVTIKTSLGDFRLKTEEMTALIEKNRGSMKFQLIKIMHEDRPGIDARLMVGNVLITQMETGYGAEIRIPYTPQEGEDYSALLIEYIDESGNTHIVTESRYEQETGCLVFFTTHFSKYGVSYKPTIFSDVSGKHWASANITYLASRGVLTGGGDGRFRPDDKVTTAEFITMMTRAFSAASLGKKTVKSYKDVSADAWYAKAIGWSYVNNISTVISKNGQIYPDQALNRQDMAALANNISLSLRLKLRENKQGISFQDQGQIASYAKPGVERMVKCGILAGNSSGKLMPNSKLTRAEASKVISTLMAGMK